MVGAGAGAGSGAFPVVDGTIIWAWASGAPSNSSAIASCKRTNVVMWWGWNLEGRLKKGKARPYCPIQAGKIRQ